MSTARAVFKTSTSNWCDICAEEDLVPYSGVAALVGDRQVAIFYLPDMQPSVYALDNYCPCAQANVLSRGIVGDLGGHPVVASPLYKEHFRLDSGACIEKEIAVKPWTVQIHDGRVLLQSV